MAMVLDALAAHIENRLIEMVEEKVHTLLGVPSEIDKMKTKLTDLKRFLADADRRNITDETVGGWVKEFRDAMYDATDILDLCQLKAMEQGPGRDMGCFNPLFFCIRNPLHAHHIGSHLKILNAKIDDISRRSKQFNFILTSYEGYKRDKKSLGLDSLQTTGEHDKLGVVGEKIEEETRNLVELLTRKEETKREPMELMVFAIVGVGGIGKTTLAQNIFNNEIIQQEFQKNVWLSVNQNFNELDLLRRTITEAGGDCSAAGDTKATLVRVLREALKGYKTLLVMDDVWDHRAWEFALKTPLTNVLARGSRVLITTRHDMVARKMKAEKPYHRVDKLEQEDAWSLLKKQVVENESDESLVDMLKYIGMGIIARCDGLPLAVKAMGGLLSKKKLTRHDWESVLNHSVWSVSHIPEDLNNAIFLSYQVLPFYLKPCFLHFSMLPTCAMFVVDDVVGMWISEGFIHGSSSCDLEQLGREYYDELIMRNLIEPDTRHFNQQRCTMHDVVRSFAHYMARDEALVAQNSKSDIIGKLNSEKFIRRVSVEINSSELEKLEWMSLQTKSSLRTLIWIGPIEIKPGNSLVSLSCLRTLHVQDAKFDASVLAGPLVQLKHLRYLSVKNTNTSMLPENIGNKMKLLQYISLYGCRSLVQLPDSIQKLQHLRYLNLTDSGINNVPKGFSSLTNLRKLYGFPCHMDSDWCSFEELGPLSMLTELYINQLQNISSPVIAKKARLCEKVHLNYFSLNYGKYKGDLAEQQQIQEEVLEELCPPPCVEYFSIVGYSGRQLPSWMVTAAVASLRNLRILAMRVLPYCIDIPDSLCRLPCLEFLYIRQAPQIKNIGIEFLQPYNHEHLSAVGNVGSAVKLHLLNCRGLERVGIMPKTQKLTIENCPKLKVLEGMPVLQTLVLADFKKKELPGYLQDVNPKQLLEITECDISLLTSIATGKSGPEWEKFCHVRQVKAYAADDYNDIERRWYVVYSRDPFSFKTNISRSDMAQARREQTQRLLLAYERRCPIEEKQAVGHACADNHQPLCHRFRCNAYRHLVYWLRKACLHCCEADDIADPSDQWTEAADYPACTACTPQEVQEDSSSESATTETGTETSDYENVGEQRNDDKLLSSFNCFRGLVRK